MAKQLICFKIYPNDFTVEGDLYSKIIDVNLIYKIL